TSSVKDLRHGGSAVRNLYRPPGRHRIVFTNDCKATNFIHRPFSLPETRITLLQTVLLRSRRRFLPQRHEPRPHQIRWRGSAPRASTMARRAPGIGGDVEAMNRTIGTGCRATVRVWVDIGTCSTPASLIPRPSGPTPREP